MIICSECGTQLVDEAKFCHMCGKTVVRKDAKCSNCGELLKEGARFCFICGTPVNGPVNNEPKAIVINEAPSKPISPLICELCGSNNLIKEDGLFTCQHCGTRYTLEEARKLITGTVKIDNTEMIGNYLMMAENAFKAGNYIESETYANKAIEIDPQNVEAWFLKGKAAGWQSTAQNIRLNESINCWGNAIKFSQNDSDLKKRVADSFVQLCKDIMPLKVDVFVQNPTKANADMIMKMDELLDAGNTSSAFVEIESQKGELRESIAIQMQTAAMNAYKAHTSYYDSHGKLRDPNYYSAWIDTMDLYILVLSKAMEVTKTSDLLLLFFKNAVWMHEAVIGSFPCKMVGNELHTLPGLRRSDKNARRNKIVELAAKKNKLLTSIMA